MFLRTPYPKNPFSSNPLETSHGLQVQLDADLIADLLCPVLELFEAVLRDDLGLKQDLHVLGNAIQRLGVASDRLLNCRELGVDRLQFVVE